MSEKYTLIDGLLFPKGSDREYVENWESVPERPIMRKTIDGQMIVEGKERCMLTITGSGDVLPACTLGIGDKVTIQSASGKSITMRFKSWSYKYVPWQFAYNWSYSFVEMEDAY